MRIRLAKALRRADQIATGLRLGMSIDALKSPGPEPGSVWVECPEVETTRHGETKMQSAGYVVLKADEYELI